jgi:hypothetical protein
MTSQPQGPQGSASAAHAALFRNADHISDLFPDIPPGIQLLKTVITIYGVPGVQVSVNRIFLMTDTFAPA